MTHRLGPSLKGTITLARTDTSHLGYRLPAVPTVSITTTTNTTCARNASSQAAAIVEEEASQGTMPHSESDTGRKHLSHIARQKQADKEFFTNLLSSAATKRDAKAYISRLKTPQKAKPVVTIGRAQPRVNLGGLFGNLRAVEQNPVFTQYEPEHKAHEEAETLHVALVKLSELEKVPDSTVVGIAETLCQLARLSMFPCVVLESSNNTGPDTLQQLKLQAERLSVAIDGMHGHARSVEGVFTIPTAGKPEIALSKLVLTPLRRGIIPIIIPNAYSEEQQSIIVITADDAVLALTREFAEQKLPRIGEQTRALSKQVSLDRIIVVDHGGGIPSLASADGKHVFLNLEQEYTTVLQELADSADEFSTKHLNNLKMLRQALKHLPPTASGLLATLEEAANMVQVVQDSSPAMVGTRRQKNTLIHNLLTDKPAHSSSLPKGRLFRKDGISLPPPVPTFVKHGMPLTIFPDPRSHPWLPDGPRVKLTDTAIDLERLVYLIDDSFNRRLDTEQYLKRVNESIAGVIIAGDYEGGAILTWETPPGSDKHDSRRLVPYLDKFAVLKRSQGAGGVADIVFNAMVRTCFPNGVCWRSRKDNPVNKWYFERSRGTKKIPDMNWTMFWTTPGVPEDIERFQDYEGVCRAVVPTWIDKKMAAD